MSTKSDYEILVENITESKEVIYHTVNGEIKEVKPIWKIVEEAIKHRTPDILYISMESECGKMINEVYIIGECGVIRSHWSPATGYSWDEYKLTLLRLKTP